MDKLIQSWESRSIAPGSFKDYEGVTDLSDHMIERYLTKIQIANERLFWLGKAATPLVMQFSAAYPGLLNQIASATGTYKVSLAGTANTSDTSTGISASGIVTVADTTKYQNGDVLTINVTTGGIAETTNIAAPGVALLNNPQSYFIQVLTATTLQLTKNYNDVNSRKPATFTGTATTAGITFINVSNILKVLGTVYATVDYADRQQDDFKVMLPLHLKFAYTQAQAVQGINVLGAFNEAQKSEYLGIPLEFMNHWKANTIIGARVGNLFLGVDLLSDESELSTVYLKPYTNDNVVRMKARMKSAVNFKFANEIFYLSN